MEDIRYPIGKFQPVENVTKAQRDEWIEQIARSPEELRVALHGLTDEQIDTPYREGGWTVRQIVHHLAENDLVTYTRFKHALTEDNPHILRAAEDRWAELPDEVVSVESSVNLFGLVRERWVVLMKGLDDDDFARAFIHPVIGPLRLDQALGQYAWHSRHHVAQISAFKGRRLN